MADTPVVMKALLQGLCGHPANVVRGARNYLCADVPGAAGMAATAIATAATTGGGGCGGGGD